jgi:cytochrome c biogenesis protein CcdA
MRKHLTLQRWGERFLGGFKYVVAGYMMLAGIATVFAPADQTVSGIAQVVYSTHIGLIVAGIIIFISGTVLLVGKIKRNKTLTGRGLLYCYLCFLFAAILNAAAYGDPTTWIGNLVMAIILGVLYLRWKFKTQYVNPRHFINDTMSMRNERK